jgi:hypothetical protein
MVKDAYNNILSQFGEPLDQISVDINKPEAGTGDDRYMTKIQKMVVNFDKLKLDFVKNMALTNMPLSCDALHYSSSNGLFLIEFKNGIIEALKNYEIKVKIFESLLLLSEILNATIKFTRDHLTFILVYNENVQHGQKQFEDTGINSIQTRLFSLAKTRKIRFGLHRFKKLYFKEVYTYTKAEFNREFVLKYCS